MDHHQKQELGHGLSQGPTNILLAISVCQARAPGKHAEWDPGREGWGEVAGRVQVPWCSLCLVSGPVRSTMCPPPPQRSQQPLPAVPTALCCLAPLILVRMHRHSSPQPLSSAQAPTRAFAWLPLKVGSLPPCLSGQACAPRCPSSKAALPVLCPHRVSLTAWDTLCGPLFPGVCVSSAA